MFFTPIMEPQMDKNTENEVEAVLRAYLSESEMMPCKVNAICM